jgi:diguanylate cyclase (GGDEF)-like protein
LVADEEHRTSKTQVTVVSRVADKPVTKEAALVVIYGHDLGRKHDLSQATVTIGRSSRSDLQVDQESVSRAHARILNTGKTIILRDLGSTNGTYVNDELIDEYVLRDGDFIKIGRTIFKFLSGSNIETAYHEEIYRLTTVDGLTQIFNKRYFLETLEREISRAHRYHRDVTLILFDIDHFKSVNDTFGHLAGDTVLKQLAQVIRGRIRREDIMARYGGEEFAILLPEIALANGMQFAEKVRKMIERTTFKFEDQKIPITVSVGVAQLGAAMQSALELIKAADEELYRAKQDGRNRVCG